MQFALEADTKNYLYKDTYAVNANTGEVVNTISITAPIGSILYTPEQQEMYKRKKEIDRIKETKRRNTKELGGFYFILADNPFPDLAPETITKLIMLCSYLNFENKFMFTERTPMKKADIQRILQLSRSATYKFLQEVFPKYIIEEDDVLRLKNTEIILRGKINSDKKYKQYQQFYINCVRKLYNSVSPRQHAQLGYIFKLLPYINIEYNIICSNPFENDLYMVQPLSVGEFCEKINYKKDNFAKLLKAYRQIVFPINGRKEYFVTYVSDGSHNRNMRFYVNPHIVYAGSNYSKVEILGAFCNS